MKKFIHLLIMALAAFVIPSCSEEELNPESIFDTTSPQRNEFDTWILKNYTEPFNIDLKYRFEDIESDLDYNVVPAKIENSIALAQLVKYLWMDVYVDQRCSHPRDHLCCTSSPIRPGRSVPLCCQHLYTSWASLFLMPASRALEIHP